MPGANTLILEMFGNDQAGYTMGDGYGDGYESAYGDGDGGSVWLVTMPVGYRSDTGYGYQHGNKHGNNIGSSGSPE